MFTIGIDFGTLSGRAVLVDARSGDEVASSVCEYPDAVIDKTLPGSSKRLPPDWALQNPLDYVTVIKTTIPDVLAKSGVNPADVKGIGIDFTACTMLPVKADGTPLMAIDSLKDNPHAWVKLWKHHASQPQADQINETARRMNQDWLQRYGGKISSEWFFSKALQILQEAPDVYAEADRLLEAADWVVWQLTGKEVRNACTAGYKAMVQDGDFPPLEYFAALDPAFASVVDDKMSRDFAPLGARAGGLTKSMAQATGLLEGTAVAVANVDAHVAAPAVKATGPGVMVMIMGTSTCHIMSGERLENVDGMCGVVDGGIIPGLYGYEAGQSCVGDMFAWFVEQAVPPETHQAAANAGLGIHEYLEQQAAKQQVGEHGLLALDWWNGNRSTLVDAELSGMLLGMTLATRPADIYRALIESTAYGTREIIEAFEARGVPVTSLIAAGGLPEKNALLRQIYADVTGRPLRLAGSAQAPALGAAMHAAVAAGIFKDIQEAASQMGKLKDEVVTPDPKNHEKYSQLFAEYKKLYDYFGRGENDVMKTLRELKRNAFSATGDDRAA